MYKDAVYKDGKRYLVSTVSSRSHGCETAIFKYNEDGTLDYKEIFSKKWRANESPKSGHKDIVKNFDRFLPR